jgi:hypothetical protein
MCPCKGLWGRENISTYIHNLKTDGVVSFMLLPLYSQRNNGWYKLNLRMGKSKKGPGYFR